MSLTVTVQKGHDFSSGNITRAALNAGAVPTVAVTGSVGTSELGTDAVTATELADDAVTTSHILNANVTTGKIADNAVDLTKLADYDSLKRGTLIKTGDTAVADTIIPEAFVANTANKILIGDGNDLLSLGHETANETDGDTTKDQPKSHVEIGLTTPVGDAVTTGVLLTLKNFAIKVSKLAKNIVGGAAKPGVIVYGGDGVASVLDSTGADSKVLVTNNTATPSFKVVNKKVDLLGASGRTTIGTSSTGEDVDILLVKAHELGSFPTNVSFYLECTQTDKDYIAGDRVVYHGSNDNSKSATYGWDGANVYASFNFTPSFPNKVTSASDATNSNSAIEHHKWKVVALVSE